MAAAQQEKVTPASKGKGESRTWTNRRGRPLAVGVFVRMDGKKVILRTPDGKEVNFPLSLLSDEDKTKIEKLREAVR